MKFTGKWIALEIIILSEVTQTPQKSIVCFCSERGSLQRLNAMQLWNNKQVMGLFMI